MSDEKLELVGYEGGGATLISWMTPALAHGDRLINPAFRGDGGASPLKYLPELVEEGNVTLLEQPRPLDLKYLKADLVLLMVRTNAMHIDLCPEACISTWNEGDPLFTFFLFDSREQFNAYRERAIMAMVPKLRTAKDPKVVEDLHDKCFILDSAHPIVNALHVKTAPDVDKRVYWERLARACLRGRVAEFEEELARPDETELTPAAADLEEWTFRWVKTKYALAIAAGNVELQGAYGALINMMDYTDTVRMTSAAIASDTLEFLVMLEGLKPGVPGALTSRHQALKTLLEGVTRGEAPEPKLIRLQYEAGALPFLMESTHWAARIIAESLAESVRKHDDAEEYWNYLSMQVTHPNAGPMTVVVQRDWADTPIRKLATAEKKIAELEAQLAAAKEAA